MPRISKTQRWLDLIAHLVGRRYPLAAGELLELPAYAAMTRATAQRVFERDLRELRDAGIPIVTRRESAGGNEESDGYLLASGDFYLPYLQVVSGGRAGVVPGVARPGTIRLSEADASDAMEALGRVARLPGSPLADEARRAHAKLALDFDPGSFPGAPVLYADPPGGAEPREVLRALTDAVMTRRRVRFRYHGIARAEATDRRVAPYGLLRTGGSWYLVGHDEERGALREFRVRRVEAVSAEPGRGAFEVPGDFHLEDRIGREAWELGDDPPLEARVRFDFPLSLWADRNGRGELVETGPDGASVRRFRVRQVDPFLRWLLSLAGEARVLDPPALREAAAALARSTARVYGDHA